MRGGAGGGARGGCTKATSSQKKRIGGKASLPLDRDILWYLTETGMMGQKDVASLLAVSRSLMRQLFPSPALEFEKMTRIDLSDCAKMKGLPFATYPPRLRILNLTNCVSLIHLLPENFPDTLRVLILNGCRSLAPLHAPNTGIEELQCRRCPALTPSTGLDQTRISLLDCSDCLHLENLPAVPQTLRRLACRGCKRLESLEGIAGHPSLEDLDCSVCYELTRLPYRMPPRLSLLNCSFCEYLEVLPPLPASMLAIDHGWFRRVYADRCYVMVESRNNNNKSENAEQGIATVVECTPDIFARVCHDTRLKRGLNFS